MGLTRSECCGGAPDSQRRTSDRLLESVEACHSERSEESRHLRNQANTEILRRLRLLRMTVSGVFQRPAKATPYWLPAVMTLLGILVPTPKAWAQG